MSRSEDQSISRQGIRVSGVFVMKDKHKINNKYQEGNNIKDSVIHNQSPLFLHYPENNNQGQNSGKNVKGQKIHGLLNSSLDNLIDIIRNNMVMAMPTEQISQGLSPTAPGENTPITNEANIIFAPSRKKFDTVFSSFLLNIQFNSNTSVSIVKGKVYQGM